MATEAAATVQWRETDEPPIRRRVSWASGIPSRNVTGLRAVPHFVMAVSDGQLFYLCDYVPLRASRGTPRPNVNSLGGYDAVLAEMLEALAATGGTAVVAAMATDAWESARSGVARLL